MGNFLSFRRPRSGIENCLNDDALSDRERNKKLWKLVKASYRLSKVREHILERDPNPEWIADHIRAKELRGGEEASSMKSLSRLSAFVTEMCEITDFVYRILDMKTTEFDRSNEEDEQKLEMIWKIATDDRTREGGRISPEWNIIGFQGKDPATDFRGGGVLSLNQLLFVTKTQTELVQKQISEPNEPQNRYPWACTGINITEYLFTLLNSRTLDEQLLGLDTHGKARRFDDLYVELFENFHEDWLRAQPCTVLEFPRVFQASMKAASRQFASGLRLQTSLTQPKSPTGAAFHMKRTLSTPENALYNQGRMLSQRTVG